MLKNRFVMAPMGPAGLADAQGAFTQTGIDFYVERAKGGVGLIIAGMCYSENTVERHGPGTMPCPTLNPVLSNAPPNSSLSGCTPMTPRSFCRSRRALAG